MFVKYIFVVLVIAIPSIIGLKKSRKYEQREQVLKESEVLFKRISQDMKYSLTTIPNAIEGARQDFNTMLKDILGSISTAILNNTYSDMEVIGEIDTLPALKPYDKQVISKGITSLGTSDIDTQLNIIQNTIGIIQELEEEARADKNKNSKLYRTLGLVTGLMLAIIVI